MLVPANSAIDDTGWNNTTKHTGAPSDVSTNIKYRVKNGYATINIGLGSGISLSTSNVTYVDIPSEARPSMTVQMIIPAIGGNVTVTVHASGEIDLACSASNRAYPVGLMIYPLG